MTMDSLISSIDFYEDFSIDIAISDSGSNHASHWGPQQQRELYKTGLMSRTSSVQVRYRSLCISQLPPAKQQREMTKFCVF